MSPAAPTSPRADKSARPHEKPAPAARPDQAGVVIETIEGRYVWQDDTWTQDQDDEAVAMLDRVLSPEEDDPTAQSRA